MRPAERHPGACAEQNFSLGAPARMLTPPPFPQLQPLTSSTRRQLSPPAFRRASPGSARPKREAPEAFLRREVAQGGERGGLPDRGQTRRQRRKEEEDGGSAVPEPS
ncbi:Hypothetical predicted protein [Podarcis lilfordi]|uniref:Uncharacterized protein n=1 Tax=Podarcis lilfordi TaxID=74358 RepID=A0AA35PGB8_9SAUR|nr:Hypothetical predicted protein [Podarcis lilfordi]